MNYICWTDGQLKEVGIDKRRLAVLLKKFKECGEAMKDLGLSVYATDGIGNLIHQSRPDHSYDGKADTGAVVACIGWGYDGGGW